jgi:hypothetical protein
VLLITPIGKVEAFLLLDAPLFLIVNLNPQFLLMAKPYQ